MRAWWRGRLGRGLAVEVVILASLLTLYRFGRYLGRDQVERAFAHAHDIVVAQRWLGLPSERWLQSLVIDHLAVIRFLNRYYAMVHFPATVAFLAVTYARAPVLYRRIRAILIGVTAVALVMQIAYPLAPPRMLAGFVDTIAVHGPAIYERSDVSSVANQYAAMPSLHVGWAFIVAYGIRLLFGRRWGLIGTAHAVITVAAVVLTANHYWADIAVAAALVAAAVAVTERHRVDRQVPTAELCAG